MDLYGQEPEVKLLGCLVEHLADRVLLDVGAERGEVTEALLRRGIETAHAFEPHPANVESLQARFAGDSRVIVHQCALSDEGGTGQLRLSVDREGAPISFGHTLTAPADKEAIRWQGSIPVELRTVGALIASGEVPRRVGILKIDTEGNDLAVIRGMEPLDADAVMVEHWRELPEGLGLCPWSTEEMVAELRPRGFTHFLYLIHRGEFVSFAWDDGEAEAGAMGNLLFLHERLLDRALPSILAVLAELSDQAVAIGLRDTRAAAERLEVIDGLVQAAEERLALINEVEGVAAERLTFIEELRELAATRATELADSAARIEALEAELAAARAAIR